MIAQGILVAVILWCIVINSQPSGVYFGIDWRADDLDGTLFWSSLLLLIIVAVMAMVGYKNNQIEWTKTVSNGRFFK